MGVAADGAAAAEVLKGPEEPPGIRGWTGCLSFSSLSLFLNNCPFRSHHLIGLPLTQGVVTLFHPQPWGNSGPTQPVSASLLAKTSTQDHFKGGPNTILCLPVA